MPEGYPRRRRLQQLADPLQFADSVTGKSATTIRCDEVKQRTATVRASDDGFKFCVGQNYQGHPTAPITCTQAPPP
jgi:hypothetical protein